MSSVTRQRSMKQIYNGEIAKLNFLFYISIKLELIIAPKSE